MACCCALRSITKRLLSLIFGCQKLSCTCVSAALMTLFSSLGANLAELNRLLERRGYYPRLSGGFMPVLEKQELVILIKIIADMRWFEPYVKGLAAEASTFNIINYMLNLWQDHVVFFLAASDSSESPGLASATRIRSRQIRPERNQLPKANIIR